MTPNELKIARELTETKKELLRCKTQNDALRKELKHVKLLVKQLAADNAKLRETMKRVRREIFGHYQASKDLIYPVEPHVMVPKYQLKEWAAALNESEGKR